MIYLEIYFHNGLQGSCTNYVLLTFKHKYNGEYIPTMIKVRTTKTD